MMEDGLIFAVILAFLTAVIGGCNAEKATLRDCAVKGESNIFLSSAKIKCEVVKEESK